MMLLVYALPVKGRWGWRVTLEPKVDMDYWSYGTNRTPIYLWQKPLPAGDALAIAAAGNRAGVPVADEPPPHPLKRRGNGRLPLVRLMPTSSLARASELDPAVAEQLVEAVRGRNLLVSEWLDLASELGMPVDERNWRVYAQHAFLRGQLRLMSGMSACTTSDEGWPFSRTEWRCNRCGSGEDQLERTSCSRCGDHCLYCRACLALGKNRSCSLLLVGTSHLLQPSCFRQKLRHQESQNSLTNAASALQSRWSLSPAQAHAASQALQYVHHCLHGHSSGSHGSSRRYDGYLIWAVTGAGKTEMVFPLIESALAFGGDVLIATPRKDVVLELAPRLKQAFPNIPVAALYGGSPDRWKRAPITVSTTHQLIRFDQAFHLVIVDEVDAFPYHNDPMLEHVARRACCPGGGFIFLSATPPVSMQREIKRGRIGHVKVPARFHGHPLPVPCLKMGGSRKKRMRLLMAEITASVHREAQCFVFVPAIAGVRTLVQAIRASLPAEVMVEGTSSVDPERVSKVMAFRERSIQVLVTTTILERGVTIPRSDVIVFDADADGFDEAALIQMAGRAGRSPDDPNGRIVFISAGRTASQSGARTRIRHMNRLALKQGYLRGSPDDEGVR